MSWQFRGAVVAALSLFTPRLLAAPSVFWKDRNEPQSPMRLIGPTMDETPGSRNFSVGFSFHSSYTAAAVIFSYPDGRRETHTAWQYGNDEYRKVMAELSLESSKHLAPPYPHNEDWWRDRPRQAVRSAAKLLGLPASYEVRVLAGAITPLRAQLEDAFKIRITEAVFANPHLVALYQDDLLDTAAYLRIHYAMPKLCLGPMVWETSTTYGGYGLGLCKEWWDEELCRAEIGEMPWVVVLAIHYTQNALTVANTLLKSAISASWEPEDRHAENFTLGYDAISGYDNERDYWEDVKQHLVSVLFYNPWWPYKQKPDIVMMTGDHATDEKFVEVVKAALMENMGTIPPMRAKDPMVVVAKGAAELMSRGEWPLHTYS